MSPIYCEEHMNKKLTERLNKALNKLNALVDSGVEYPDAQWKVTLLYKLNDAELAILQRAYLEN